MILIIIQLPPSKGQIRILFNITSRFLIRVINQHLHIEIALSTKPVEFINLLKMHFFVNTIIALLPDHNFITLNIHILLDHFAAILFRSPYSYARMGVVSPVKNLVRVSREVLSKSYSTAVNTGSLILPDNIRVGVIMYNKAVVYWSRGPDVFFVVRMGFGHVDVCMTWVVFVTGGEGVVVVEYKEFLVDRETVQDLDVGVLDHHAGAAIGFDHVDTVAVYFHTESDLIFLSNSAAEGLELVVSLYQLPLVSGNVFLYTQRCASF